MAWVRLDPKDPTDDAWWNQDPAELLVDATEMLAALLHRPAWHAQAACRGQGTGKWFPNRGESTEPAKTVCHSCPVQSRCLSEALRRPTWEDYGVWGGSSAQARRRLRHPAA